MQRIIISNVTLYFVVTLRVTQLSIIQFMKILTMILLYTWRE